MCLGEVVCPLMSQFKNSALATSFNIVEYTFKVLRMHLIFFLYCLNVT